MTARIVLVNMPWAALHLPSIQLGTIKALLARAGHEVSVRYLNLAFAEYGLATTAADSSPLTVEELQDIAKRPRVGDWIFAVPPFRGENDAADRAFFESELWGEPDGVERVARRLRGLAATFIERCADELAELAPKVIGFTTSFGQNVASLALARLVKVRNPETAVVFGGANCDGAMGVALHRLFAWVDVVVRGEGERVVVPIFEDLLAGRRVRDLPGVCLRETGESRAIPATHELVAMDDVPSPDYDEYFEHLEASPLTPELRSSIRLLYESARGCWWGEKNHCTFCGLNGSSMRFRSKTPERAFEEMVALGERYGSLKFHVVDNIIELRYLDELLPRVRDTGWDWNLFYETKANLKRDQLRLFRDAGVREIQPGIESLSTPILKLMKKGVTALQNIRLLKWCSELGIRVAWNIIYGFPGEEPLEYATMADLIPSLVHLEAPNAIRLSLERFSPYHADPELHGLEVLGPAAFYSMVYPMRADELSDLAYVFDYRYANGQDQDCDYARLLVERVSAWRAAPATGTLAYEVGPGFVTIEDHRPTVSPSRVELEGAQALIYLACDAGATVNQVRAFLASRGFQDHTADEITAFLDKLVELRLTYHERARYLSLATARDQHRALGRVGIAELDDNEPNAGLVQLRRTAR